MNGLTLPWNSGTAVLKESHQQVAALAPCTARSLAPARPIRRQCRERHTDVQNTAAVFTVGINGPVPPRQSRGPGSSSVTTTSLSQAAPSLPTGPP